MAKLLKEILFFIIISFIILCLNLYVNFLFGDEVSLFINNNFTDIGIKYQYFIVFFRFVMPIMIYIISRIVIKLLKFEYKISYFDEFYKKTLLFELPIVLLFTIICLIEILFFKVYSDYVFFNVTIYYIFSNLIFLTPIYLVQLALKIKAITRNNIRKIFTPYNFLFVVWIVFYASINVIILFL